MAELTAEERLELEEARAFLGESERSRGADNRLVMAKVLIRRLLGFIDKLDEVDTGWAPPPLKGKQ